MDQASEPKNLLLAQLPAPDYRRLAEHLRLVKLNIREVVCQPGEPVRHAHFPNSSMLSSIVVLSDGTAVEAATIRNEGMAGAGLLIHERASPYRVIQQVQGETLRIAVDRFDELLDSIDALKDLIQRYTFTLLQQSGQNAACNLHHRVEQRMCRWLLQTSDRAGRHNFHITQEFLSEMLGVSRQAINVAARSLQQAGLIQYRRGHVTVRDRQGLEHASCECYENFNETYWRSMRIRIVKPS